MSYLTAMLALTVQNFVSAATGIAVVIALIRGLSRKSAGQIGNFWVDLTRATLYVLLPASVLLALALEQYDAVACTSTSTSTYCYPEPREQGIRGRLHLRRRPQHEAAVRAGCGRGEVRRVDQRAGRPLDENTTLPFMVNGGDVFGHCRRACRARTTRAGDVGATDGSPTCAARPARASREALFCWQRQCDGGRGPLGRGHRRRRDRRDQRGGAGEHHRVPRGRWEQSTAHDQRNGRHHGAGGGRRDDAQTLGLLRTTGTARCGVDGAGVSPKVTLLTPLSAARNGGGRPGGTSDHATGDDRDGRPLVGDDGRGFAQRDQRVRHLGARGDQAGRDGDQHLQPDPGPADDDRRERWHHGGGSGRAELSTRTRR